MYFTVELVFFRRSYFGPFLSQLAEAFLCVTHSMRSRCRTTVGTRLAGNQGAKKLKEAPPWRRQSDRRTAAVQQLMGDDGAAGSNSQGSEVGRRGNFVTRRERGRLSRVCRAPGGGTEGCTQSIRGVQPRACLHCTLSPISFTVHWLESCIVLHRVMRWVDVGFLGVYVWKYIVNKKV